MRKQRFWIVLRVLALFAVLAVLVPVNASPAAAGRARWKTIAYEDFEAATPWPAAPWITYDASYTSTQGIWSTTFGGPASGGFLSSKAVHPRGGTMPYNYNTSTYMRYGPFSLANARDARLIFKYWLDSEVGYDLFGWGVACDGESAWSGKLRSGRIGEWEDGKLSLKECAGRPSVRIQFTFNSDQSVNYNGVSVDNIEIQTRRR